MGLVHPSDNTALSCSSQLSKMALAIGLEVDCLATTLIAIIAFGPGTHLQATGHKSQRAQQDPGWR
jgi:hypothetical protein